MYISILHSLLIIACLPACFTLKYSLSNLAHVSSDKQCQSPSYLRLPRLIQPHNPLLIARRNQQPLPTPNPLHR